MKIETMLDALAERVSRLQSSWNIDDGIARRYTALQAENARLRAELEQVTADRKLEWYLFHNGKDIYDTP